MVLPGCSQSHHGERDLLDEGRNSGEEIPRFQPWFTVLGGKYQMKQDARKGLGHAALIAKRIPRMKRPFRTQGLSSVKRSRHCVPGWDESSRWDGEGDLCIKIRVSRAG